MRRLFVVFLALLVLVCVAYTVYWNVMASRSGEWVAYWAAPIPGKAWSGTYSATEASGFPFSLDITISDPAVSWQGSGGEAIWQGPELIAKFKPWTLASFSFDLPSQQTVIIDDGYLLRMIRIMMESGTARIAMTDDRATALMARFEGQTREEAQAISDQERRTSALEDSFDGSSQPEDPAAPFLDAL